MQDCGAKRLGFAENYWQSSLYENPEIEQFLSIPVHRNQDLKIGTLRALMKIAQLSEEDLI
nr:MULTISPECIES: type II toxin-antitoxin system HicA family toxin [Cyanophyceae]